MAVEIVRFSARAQAKEQRQSIYMINHLFGLKLATGVICKAL